jgi:hypothetical protein
LDVHLCLKNDAMNLFRRRIVRDLKSEVKKRGQPASSCLYTDNPKIQIRHGKWLWNSIVG